MPLGSGNQSREVNTGPNSHRGWRPSGTTQDVLSVLGRIILVFVAVAIILLAWFFPYDTDAPLSGTEMTKEQDYYAKAFAAGDRQLNPVESPEEERYVKIGESTALENH